MQLYANVNGQKRLPLPKADTDQSQPSDSPLRRRSRRLFGKEDDRPSRAAAAHSRPRLVYSRP